MKKTNTSDKKMTSDEIELFRKGYKTAIKEEKDTFFYGEQEVLVKFAKYYLEYYDGIKNKRK